MHRTSYLNNIYNLKLVARTAKTLGAPHFIIYPLVVMSFVMS